MVSARLNECPPHAETKVCSLLNQQDIRINLRRIDPLVLLGLNSREECHGGLNMAENRALHHMVKRRRLLRAAGVGSLALTNPSWAQTMVDLPLPGGPGARAITTGFPQKGPMIMQRTRPPLLETPFEVFDKGVFTPND